MEKYYALHENASADWELFALRFAESLVHGNYVGAYSMTSADLRKRHSLPWLEAQIERLRRDSDDPLGPCHVDSSGPLPNTKRQIEGAAYITIGGTNCEGVFVSVARSNGTLEIDELLGIGRP